MDTVVTTIWRIFIVICLVAIYSTTLAQKNDTVYFLNGDKITGEIKGFKFGYMTYKTYGVSTVSIKHDKIATFHSKKNFEIVYKDGIRRYGSFIAAELDQFVNIVTMNDTMLTPLQEVVEITPIKNRFWKRLSGSFDLGYSYTKASTVSQLNFSSEVKYQQKNYYTDLQLNLNITDQDDRDRTDKNDVTIIIVSKIKEKLVWPWNIQCRA